MFLHSMEIKEDILTVSINDLIFVYNSLIEKRDIILIADHSDDPIGILLDALGNTPLSNRGQV